MKMKKLTRFYATGIFVALSALLLTACGGGGNTPPVTAPLAPSLNLTYQPIKIFQFSWADVSAETEYRLLENPDGISGFSQVATIVADATSHDWVVSLPARVNARYLLQACNSVGCTDSNEVTVDVAQLVQAVGYVKASNTDRNDRFGNSVALSGDGNTLAVGAWGEDSNVTGINRDQTDNSVSNAGAVYVFTRSGSNWSQQAYLKASNTEDGDSFGVSVALSSDGNTLAVGANREESNATGIGGDQADNSAALSGAVYVFTRSGNNWSQQTYLKASNTDSSDFFGISVTLSSDGNTLAVGAWFEASNATNINGNQADNSASYAGAVYLFTRSGSNWSQQAYLKASNTDSGDRFGWSVALSGDGNTLAVGAWGEDSNATGIDGDQADNSASTAGAVYLFTRSGSNWSQQAYLKASNTDSGDQFGISVALSSDGNTLAVGAREDSNATGINGDQGDNSISNAGAVYVFIRSGSNWSQQAYLKASTTGSDRSWSVALSGDGNTLVVGAEFEGSNATGIDGDGTDNSTSIAGAVYRFTRSNANWSQQAYIKAPNTGNGDSFGWSVALSADGRTLAVGAYGEASNATGIGGDQADNSVGGSGAVYLY